MKQSLSVKGLAVCGVCIALAFVLYSVRLFSMPLGGAATLCSMFFICIIGYLYGWKYSLPAGLAFSLLMFIQEPFFLTPVQVIIDYGLAFTSLGLSGFFKDKKGGLYIGYLVGVTGRFVFATLSGVVFYAQSAHDAGWNNVFLYSVCYNGSYIYTEAVITLIILAIPAVKHAIDRVRNMLA